MHLTEQEQQEIIRFVEAGKPLPDKYRFLLFDDKREVELVWNGKNNDVANVVLPFQTIEQVDEPRSEKHETSDAQGSLFSTDVRGRQLKGWTNKLIWGDNRLILSSLKNGPMREEIERHGGIKLIYIDPPFDVGADFSMDIEVGDETFTKEANILEEIAYRDTWGRGSDSFIAMMYERLVLLRDLLAEDGTIFVHCDWRVSAYLRLILDEVFGKSHFLNEIVWHYYNKMQGNVGRFASNHDTIFSYRKGPRSHFEAIREKRDKPKTQQKRVWDPATKSLKQAKDSAGNLLYYEDTHRTIDDVWRLPYLMPANKKEKLGYPTQKPEALITRIICPPSAPMAQI